MVRMKYYVYIFILAVCLMSCNSHSPHWEAISQVESYIEERPDSALVVLEQIDPSVLSGKEEKAKHALLHSMALDKNFIDKTDLGVLHPAIDYYEDNGSATDKLRTYYYQGRIYQNQGNDALAMECFVKALSEGDESNDILTKARTYFAQSIIYYSLYEWDSFIAANKSAALLFKESGMINSYANCLNRIINGYTLKEEPNSAWPYIHECKTLLQDMSISRLTEFYASYLTYLTNFGTEQEMNEILQEYISAVPSSMIDRLTIANAYLKMNNYNEALSVLSEYNTSSDIAKERKYLSIISDIYQGLEDHKRALESYKKYIILADSIDSAIYTQDTRFVEERHKLELQTLKEKESKMRVILWSALFIAILLSIIVFIRYRLKVNRMEKAIAEQETEKYRLLYLQIEEERDNLTNLLVQSEEFTPEIKTAVVKRLELLNKFFTAFITNNSDIDRTASKEMEELLANKDTFMTSTKLAFAGSHPKFIKYLEERGLTDWEINYCCLYALGLKGKEVGSYIKMRSHYNNSSEVRQKLGINEHDTNLGIYIRKLVKSFE